MMTLMKRIAAIALALSLAGALGAQVAPQGQKPPKGPGAGSPGGAGANPAANYTIEQSVSDQAQLSTISFSALAFMTGTFGADTFLPPGKVADYFGFQYMRDIDAKEAGHNQMFLGKIGNATLAILDAKQKALFLDLAVKQESAYQDLVKSRLVVIKAFRDNMEGKGPAGNTGLSQKAVQAAVDRDPAHGVSPTRVTMGPRNGA